MTKANVKAKACMMGSKRLAACAAAMAYALCAHCVALPNGRDAQRVWDVRDFGAQGDGLADDTAAVQRTLDEASASGGGTVRVPPGVYRIGSLSLGWNTRLELAGGVTDASSGYDAETAKRATDPEVSAILRPVRSKRPPIFLYNLVPPAYITNGCGNIAVSGGVFDCGGLALVGAFACARGLRVENAIVRDLPNNHGLQLVACENVLVTNCVFAGYSFGGDAGSVLTRETIQVEDSCPTCISGNPSKSPVLCDKDDSRPNRNVTVCGCWFGPSETHGPHLIALGHHGYPRSCDGLVFAGNTVIDPLYCGVRIANVSDALIERNRFTSHRWPKSVKDDGSFITVWGRSRLKPGEMGIVIRGNVFERSEDSLLIDMWISPHRQKEVSVERNATTIPRP